MAVLLTGGPADRPTIADEDLALTRGELNARVNRWIRLLPGGTAPVAVVAGNRVDTMAVVLACLHAGRTAVPINWHLTAPEIAYQLDDSGSAVVVCDETRAAVVAEAIRRTETAAPAMLVLGRVDAELATLPDAEPDAQVCGALMLYTSGTTGHPKGVVNGLFATGAPFRRVDSLLAFSERALSVPGDGTMLLAGPWYHSAQLFFGLLPLLRGSRLLMTDRFDPERTLELIDKEGVTETHLVPTQFVRMLRLPADIRNGFDGRTLRRVWHGGGPCSVEVKRRMIEWWGPCLVEYYGATEGGVATLIDSAEWLARPGSVGRAVPPTEVVVVDDDGRPVAPGVEGRVFVRRPPKNDFHYHNAPDKTASVHLAPGVFTYGELGRLDEDGYLFLTGRHQELIVSGGVNVYPAEVEAVLLTHPAVRDAVVVGAPDEEYGERVVAFVQLDADVPVAELDAHCRTSLAGFKVPRDYRKLAELPREPTGKVRRQVLAEVLT